MDNCIFCKINPKTGKSFCGYKCYWSFRKLNKMYPPSRKGIKHSLETKEKIRKTFIDIGFKPKINHYWLGKKRVDMAGSNHFKWIKDRNNVKSKRHCFEFSEWRKAVFERDNYTCQNCGERGGKLNADHIKPFAIFPELINDIDNGRTLCVDCHKKTLTYGRSSETLRRLFV